MNFRKCMTLLLTGILLALSLFPAGCSFPQAPVAQSATPVLTGTPSATAMRTYTPTGESEKTPTPTPSVTRTPGTAGAKFQPPEKGCAIPFREGRRYGYEMDLSLDPEARTISGHVVFRFFNDSKDPWNTLCFRDYPSLFIDPEKVGDPELGDLYGALTEINHLTDTRDRTSLTYERDRDVSVIWVPLKQPLNPKEEMTLEYDFVSTVPTLGDRYGYWEDICSAANFYPILAEYENGDWSHAPYYIDGECFYSEIADYTVQLTVPKGYTVLSTGTETDKTEGDGATVYTFDAPCVRDFVFEACPAFQVRTEVFDGVRVNVAYNTRYSPVEDMTLPLQAAMDAARDSLAAFGEAFGRYPYSELDIVFMKLSAGGMEYPNLIQIADNYCDTPVQIVPSEDPYIDLKTVIAHEIGHQWFMGIVGSNSGMQPWLDESITSYSEIVYLEYIQSSGELRRIREMYGRDSLDVSDSEIARQFKQQDYFPINRSYYAFKESYTYIASIYTVGKIALYQMEEILGRDTFHGILREYVHRNAFHNTDETAFFDVLFACAGPDNRELNALVHAAFDLAGTTLMQQ
ncbi:MAG: hypothetical protein II781_04790 [Clostridia bacterium]|nr:hypothetical protein [Clostridia bacterium]